MPEIVRYAGWDEVPDGLQPANDLRFAGLEPRGGPVAVVVLGEREVELFRRVDAAPKAVASTAARAAQGGGASGPGGGAGPGGAAAGRGTLDPSGAVLAAQAPPPEPELPPGAPGSRASRGGRARSAAYLPGRSGLLEGLRRTDADPSTARREALAWLRELLQDAFVVLDTETTGLGYDAEVIEIGIVAPDGTRVLDSFVRPRARSVPPMATRVHGLTMADLEDAPEWPEVHERLVAATTGARILAWNAAFDERMVRQTSRLWGLSRRVPRFECAMQAYALCSGSRFGRAKLERAAAAVGLLQGARQRHRSCDDALLTLQVLLRTAGVARAHA